MKGSAKAPSEIKSRRVILVARLFFHALNSCLAVAFEVVT